MGEVRQSEERDPRLTFSPLAPAGPGGPMGPVRPWGREGGVRGRERQPGTRSPTGSLETPHPTDLGVPSRGPQSSLSPWGPHF